MLTTKASKKLTFGIVTLIILTLCLCLTTFALVYSVISLENNVFSTGTVDIDLNGGAPIIKDRELVFAPGMTEEKTFYIENKSTCPVFYRLYFENVKGSLANVLTVSISDGTNSLYTGTVNDLTSRTPSATAMLEKDQKLELTISFSFPKTADDAMQNQNLEFDLRADAVQIKNNPGKLFD